MREHDRWSRSTGRASACPHRDSAACRRPRPCVPLALLSAAVDREPRRRRRQPRAVADAGRPATLPDGTTRPDRGHRGPGQRLRARRDRPAASTAALDQVVADRLDHRHPRRRARRLPARRDRHQRRRQVLQPLLAADRRDRPRRVRPRPRQRQHPRRRRASRRPASSASPSTARNNTAGIRDTDAGQYDADAKYDRAVGPMQFIPSTWSVVGVDADGDGKRNPQDIDDAALATAVYLCSGDDDLSDRGRPARRGLPLQPQPVYVDLVLSIMNAYLDGDFTSVPNGTTSRRLLRRPTPTPPGRRPGRRQRQRRQQRRRQRRRRRRHRRRRRRRRRRRHRRRRRPTTPTDGGGRPRPRRRRRRPRPARSCPTRRRWPTAGSAPRRPRSTTCSTARRGNWPECSACRRRRSTARSTGRSTSSRQSRSSRARPPDLAERTLTRPSTTRPSRRHRVSARAAGRPRRPSR